MIPWDGCRGPLPEPTEALWGGGGDIKVLSGTHPGKPYFRENKVSSLFTFVQSSYEALWPTWQSRLQGHDRPLCCISVLPEAIATLRSGASPFPMLCALASDLCGEFPVAFTTLSKFLNGTANSFGLDRVKRKQTSSPVATSTGFREVDMCKINTAHRQLANVEILEFHFRTVCEVGTMEDSFHTSAASFLFMSISPAKPA